MSLHNTINRKNVIFGKCHLHFINECTILLDIIVCEFNVIIK